MLISLTIENWMSFRDPVTFSMVASNERQHGERIPRVRKYPLRILPIAAIYGGNASGKSNLFKSLWFLQEFIVNGTRRGEKIGVEPFRLDGTSVKKPSSFEIELLINDLVYVYTISITANEVIYEKLVRITSSNETLLFERNEDPKYIYTNSRNVERQRFVREGTRSNQLFLTNSISQNVMEYFVVFNWFEEHLILIAPEAKFGSLEDYFDQNNPVFLASHELFENLDTGVQRIGTNRIIAGGAELSDDLSAALKKRLSEQEIVSLPSIASERILARLEDGEVVLENLVTYHRDLDGREIEFGLDFESDGTKRLLDLVPAFAVLVQKSSKHVFFIDELDRSLHSLLLRKLLEFYLEKCNPRSRNQLLFTTHDLLLMDQNLFRRDEMWITERDQSGKSQLIAFSDYEGIRHDTDIRKNYLQGRFGGIPNILLRSHVTIQEDED